MISPNWPAPKKVKTLLLTKKDSFSIIPSNINLYLLNQIHGKTVIDLPQFDYLSSADGSYTSTTHQACSIKTADCLAILICKKDATAVAALHAGWRGLAKGIIAEGIKKFNSSPDKLMVWIGPAICPKHYEVDHLVYDAICAYTPEAKTAFTLSRADHWQCDLKKIAQLQLNALGVEQIFSSNLCTFEEESILYSYRLNSDEKGRLVHIIWLEP